MPEHRLIPMRDSFGAIVEAAGGEALSDLETEVVRVLFRRFGSLVFRGFAADTDSFMKFTERFHETFWAYRASHGNAFGRQMIEGIPTLLTVTAHDQTFPIPMHGEMYFGADRPAVLWFRCVRAPRFGGDTLLADGAEIAEQLGASARRLFETKRLLYVRDDGTVRTEFPCSAFTADGRFINSILPLVQAEAAFARIDQSHDPRFPRRGFPISVRLEDGQRIPDEVLEDVERAVKASTFRLRWRNGDVAMLDNARVMHGRGKSVATDREIQVRLAMPDGRR